METCVDAVECEVIQLSHKLAHLYSYVLIPELSF